MSGEAYTPAGSSRPTGPTPRAGALVHYAVDPKGIERVTGYADTRPLEGEAPDSESNQRITLSLSLSKLGDKPVEKEAVLAPGAKANIEAAPGPADPPHPSS